MSITEIISLILVSNVHKNFLHRLVLGSPPLQQRYRNARHPWHEARSTISLMDDGEEMMERFPLDSDISWPPSRPGVAVGAAVVTVVTVGYGWKDGAQHGCE